MAETEKLPIITVKSNVPDNKTAFWEKHPDHPDGEVFVYGEDSFKVARTPEAELKLRNGDIVEAKGDKLYRTTENIPSGNTANTPDADRLGDAGDAENAKTSGEKPAEPVVPTGAKPATSKPATKTS